MKIREAISAVRNQLKDYSGETLITDEFIYFTLNNIRLTLLKEVYKDKKNISKFDYTEYCIELETAKAHDCDCVKYGCEVKKSVFTIPRSVMDSSFKIYTLNRDQVSFVEPNLQKYRINHPVLSDKMSYSILNDKVIIWNNDTIKTIIVSGIWVDETDWAGKSYCDENIESSCIDNPLDLAFNILPELQAICVEQTFKVLANTLNIKSDITNDSQPETRFPMV